MKCAKQLKRTLVPVGHLVKDMLYSNAIITASQKQRPIFLWRHQTLMLNPYDDASGEI